MTRALALLTLAACQGNASSGNDCIPPPRACDGPAPALRPVDTARACLADAVILNDVCSTSVNRCAPSAGLGPVCAFAPDGGVFFSIGSDNDIFTADGWRFSQYNGGATWWPIAGEEATSSDEALCARARCMPACPGTQAVPFGGLCADAGARD